MIGNVGAVFEFEWKRALSLTRRLWWVALAAFPIFIIGLVRSTVSQTDMIRQVTPVHQQVMQPATGASRDAESGDKDPRTEIWRQLCAWLFFALVPMLVSTLGTLLWTTPVISAELERRSWVYLAVRPNGAAAVLLGKYLAAVTWVIPAAVLGLTIAVPLAETGDTLRIWRTMVTLVCLSCPAYAAVYVTLGVLLPRRAVVLAVAYTLLFEMIVSFVPAMINKVTIQYRLRALAALWCDLKIPGRHESDTLPLVGNESAWVHISVLAGIVIGLLIVSIVALRASEFSTSAETDI